MASATKVVGKIYATTNYDMFTYRSDNRSVNEENVRAKIKSIEIMGQQVPIKVDGQNVIQDGQHRLEACKRLSIPVEFIIDADGSLTTRELALLQSSTKAWTKVDYANSFAQSENGEDYRLYNQFCTAFPEFGHTTVLMLLMNMKTTGASADTTFKGGNFKVKSYNRGKQMAETLRQFAPFYKNYMKKSFIVAFAKMYEHKEFDFSRLLRKLPKRCKEIMDFSRTEDYLEALEIIYNWKETKKVYFR